MSYYNNFYKLSFIDSVESDYERKIYKSLFNKSKRSEELFDKDLYNFTDSEIEAFLYSVNTSSRNTLITYVNVARKYVDFAIENGDRISNINLFKTFTYDTMHNYLQAYKSKYLSEVDFNINVDMLYNHCDRAIILSIYHGMGGFEYQEITNLTIDDVKEAKTSPSRVLGGQQYYYIKLREKVNGYNKERYLDIPKSLLIELEKTYYEDTYYLNNGDSNGKVKYSQFIEGKHIFRNINLKKNTSEEKIDKQIIYRRINKLKSITNDSLGSIKTVHNSGFIYNLYLLSKDGKLDFYDVLEVIKRFNLFVNEQSTSFTIKKELKKYEEALKNIYNVEVVNKP